MVAIPPGWSHTGPTLVPPLLTAESTVNSREFRGFRPAKVLEHRILADPDEDARNTARHPHRVTPTSLNGMRITEGSAHVVLPPMPWNMIRFAYL